MDIKLKKSALSGEVSAISSKSAVHRLLISAFLCDTPTYVDFNGLSKDISATISCLTVCGATISTTDTGVLLTPPSTFAINPHINCGESGSTLRFLLPVMSALFETYSVTAKGGLQNRPLHELIDCLSSQGASFSAQSLPLSACKKLSSGEFSIAGNVSSQYISGLMFALPKLDGDSKIVLTSALSSSAYVDMTIATLADFGITIERTDYGFFIKGGQKYISPERISAEGDWSSATFWLCAGAVSSGITVNGLLYNSLQADRRILDILSQIGAKITVTDNSVTVSQDKLQAVSVDIDSSPDVMPVLTMLFSFCDGVSTIYNGARLHIKESDRILEMANVLSALSIPVAHSHGEISVTGTVFSSGIINSANDHRIVMAAALAAIATDVTILGADCVDKSYPSFFEDFKRLGGIIENILWRNNKMQLKDLRNEIDNIDDEICKLFAKRMDAVSRVSELKTNTNLKVLDKSREREILSRVTQLCGDDMQSYSKELFTTLMSLSRSYQRLKRNDGAICAELQKAMDETEQVFPKRATVACQGIEGAYSQITCDKLFSLPSIMYFNDFAGVFSAVEHGLCRYGILPIENSTHGSVYQTYDLMNKHKFYIVRSFKLKLSHALLMKPNTKISEIKKIISHEQALSQCSDFLSTLSGVDIVPVSNTAVAAKIVAEGDDKSIACISSPDCADTYGLDAYPKAIQNSENNYTRFICIGQKPEIFPGSNRISLMLNVRHEPGALYEVISRFAALDINIRKIESRPIPETDFDFTFYFDVEADLRSPEILKLIGSLSDDLPSFVFLGSYRES